MNRYISIALIAGALCSGGAAEPAAAQTYALRQAYSPDSTRMVTEARIPLLGVDMSSSAGVRELLARIEDAADTVCGGRASAISRDQLEDYRECRRAAVSGAVARMRNPALADLASRRRMEVEVGAAR